jgi:hypothetical protein
VGRLRRMRIVLLSLSVCCQLDEVIEIFYRDRTVYLS